MVCSPFLQRISVSLVTVFLILQTSLTFPELCISVMVTDLTTGVLSENKRKELINRTFSSDFQGHFSLSFESEFVSDSAAFYCRRRVSLFMIKLDN